MTTAEIISLTRNQVGGCTTNEITDTQMLVYLNMVYKDLFSAILSTDKKLTRNEWIADTVAGQSEYTLPVLNTLTETPGLKRLITMYIKYKSSDTEHTRMKAFDYEDFELSLSEMRGDVDQKDIGNSSYPYPFIVRTDTVSFFVNPAPEESIVGGLKIQGTYFPLDLTLLSESDDIKLQREFHETISLGMEQYIYGFRQLDNKRNIAMNRYGIVKQNMLSYQYNVEESAREDKLPTNDLYYLQ